MTTPLQEALWANSIIRNCLLECDGDVSAAMLAAELNISTQPIPEDYVPLSIHYKDHSPASHPGMEVDIGQPKSAPGPAFPVDPDDYPRNKSNQFIPKKVLAKAARKPEEHHALKETLPPEQHYKLEKAISHLQSGGTVNHPNEHSKLGVDVSGEIADRQWAYHQWRVDGRKEWEQRNTTRGVKRSKIVEATKLVRNSTPTTKLYKSISSLKSGSGNRSVVRDSLDTYDTYLDDVIEALESISTDDSQLRELDRLRHSADMEISRNIDKEDLSKIVEEHLTKIHNQFEDILEESHNRLDEEEGSDIEPEIPEEPREDETNPQHPTASYFSVDSATIDAALATQVTWQPYHGPRGGRGWKSSTGRIVYGGNKPTSREGGEQDYGRYNKASRVPTIGSVRGRGDTTEPETSSTSSEVETPSRRPIDKETNRVRTDESVTTSDKTPTTVAQPRPVLTGDIDRDFKRYEQYFNRSRRSDIAEWFGELKEHIESVGSSKALEALGGPSDNTSLPQEKVQYKGTGYFKGDKGLAFLEKYLDEVGITLVTGNRYSKSKKLIASAPVESAVKAAKKGDIVAVDPWREGETKLEESKLLPGLESSEDIHKVVGHEVTQFTPEVISKFDAKYGKGKWIIKSYGNEAYAGFGVFFPQRLAEIKRESRQTIYETSKELKKLGYTIYRENGQVKGITNNAGKVYKFSSTNYAEIPEEKVRKLARVIEASSPEEHGARLPTTPEKALSQDYGILLTKNNDGKVTGMTDANGDFIPYNSPKWRKMVDDEYSNIGKDLERAVSAASDKSEPDARFMVQPAFKVVGVTELDRALGFTWETSNEGRVHVTTSGGKASVIPYATLAGRADAFPVVFANDDIRAMERAVQDAIDALPDKMKNGAVYAPDVIKTTEGWKVVELNAANEFGQSLWLEENPFVIDAYVSHLTGRKPGHVQFIQSLLQGEASKLKNMGGMDTSATDSTGSSLKGKSGNPDIARLRAKLHRQGPTLSVDSGGREHKGKGEGGGQFVSKGKGGSSINRTAKETNKIKEVIPSTEDWNKDLIEISNKLKTYGLYTELDSESHVKEGGGLCYDASKRLQDILNESGTSTKLVTGYHGGMPHTWLETRDGTIIDGTEWQFNNSNSYEVNTGQITIYNKNSEEAKGYFPDEPEDTNHFIEEGDEHRFEFTNIQLSTDELGHEHAPAGSGKGGQFVKKGGGGSSVGKTNSGNKSSNPDRQGQKRIEKTGGPGGIGSAIKGAVSGAIRGALIGGKSGATGKPQMISRQEHDKIVEKALTKLEKVIPPTPQEVAENQAGIERLGANIFRRNLVGNTGDRRRRREKLMAEFGDGVQCPCIYCGLLLNGDGDLEQDKIFTTEQGGRYRMSNLVPSCSPCNKKRGDMPFTEALEKVVDYAGDKLEYQRT